MTETFDASLGRHDNTIRAEAESDYVSFWAKQAKRLSWFEPPKHTLQWDPPHARWFEGGKINASYNALDVHQKTRSSKPAILWEGEDGSSCTITYEQLWIMVQKCANVLKSLGIKSGDRVAIYLPMIPEALVSILACARIGATHTVVFSGFSASSLCGRISDSGAKIVITADGGYRRGKVVNLKSIVDEAIDNLDSVQNVLVVSRTKTVIKKTSRDVFWDELMSDVDDKCDAEPLDSLHPLYILYTSGTTGKPKGVLHGTGGYLVHLYSTFGWAFDIQDSDVYFCTADIGWVTGHSYVAYAPLLHGATVLIYEGAPDYPDISRMWDIIQKYKVTIFYTTPTALRMFVKYGDDIPNSKDLSSLRLLGTVGEPINPDVWKWYYNVIGKKHCPIIDTWWQTETGGMLISALPGLETIPLKPGSAARPIPGVDIQVVDVDGNLVPTNTKGHLVVNNPWPGMLLTLWGDDAKYKSVYWSKYPGRYYSGDYAIKDEDGYLWLLGRADDVLKIAGHRIGTAEIESALVSHSDIAEAAVCGILDEIKGEAIIAFVVTRDGVQYDDSMRKELIQLVRSEVGPIAVIQQIHFVSRLPKTRSGKIMRRLLKAAAQNEKIGDTSTLEDGTTIQEIQDALGLIQDSMNS